MARKGTKITEYDRDNLEVTEEQFKLIVEYGAKTILEKAFCSFMIDSMSRRIVAEFLKFDDIDIFNNKFKKTEAYKGAKNNTKKIQNELKKGLIKEVKDRNGNNVYKTIATGYFTNRTKNLLIELQDDYKKGFVFRRNKDSKKSLTPSALSQMWDRCIEKTNKKIIEWNMDKKLLIRHPDSKKTITLHDIRRARPRNFEPETYEDVQVMQKMLTHKNIATTYDIYARLGSKKMQKKLDRGLYKENE